MANRTLFSNSNVPATNTVNEAGGKAYAYSDKHALAQLAATNTFNGTFYADAEHTLKLAQEVALKLKNDPVFVAKVAVYCRQNGYMKDMPAFLCAVLASWGEHALFRAVFDKVIDNGKMLRNFIQIGRSGAAGKKLNMSSGAVRHAIRDWFKRPAEVIFRNDSIGNDPSMRDILKMAHPKPHSPQHAALFAYLLGAEREGDKYVVKYKGNPVYVHSFTALPANVQQYENFKATHKGEIPDVDFRMLDSVLSKEELTELWKSQVENAKWHSLRMNLNNFQKYGVFDDVKLTSRVAARLADKEAVRRSRCFPYQLLTTYQMTTNVPHVVREAIQDAMEIAVENVPVIEGQVYVGVDVSGSMSAPVTGNRGSASTLVQCRHVAALYASAMLRTNKSSVVIPFCTKVHSLQLNPRDSIMTNVQKLNSLPSGGTACSAPVAHLNAQGAKGDMIIIVSDNQSWYDIRRNGSALMEEWKKFKRRNPQAKLVCIDLEAHTHSQAAQHEDILCVGGFSDVVWDVINSFYHGGDNKDEWVEIINSIQL